MFCENVYSTLPGLWMSQVTKFCTFAPNIYGSSVQILFSYTYNFEVPPRFLENLWTPAHQVMPVFCTCNTQCQQVSWDFNLSYTWNMQPFILTEIQMEFAAFVLQVSSLSFCSVYLECCCFFFFFKYSF